MAYKKYIKRNGKVYGPYLYQSKRVNGRVISEYKGHNFDASKKFFGRNFFVVFSVLVFALLLIFFVQNSQFTGRSIVNFKSERVGDSIVGDLEFVMYGGELIPANSEVVIENGNVSYVFGLSEILGDQVFEGEYFLDGVSLTGEGEGYGLVGKREVFPVISFDLELFEVVEIVEGNETIGEENSVILTFDVSGSDSVEYSIDGYSDYSIYNVRVGSESLDSSHLNVKESDGLLIITTDYALEEEGFGEDFLTDFEKIYSVDVSSLGVNLTSGELIFRMSFEDVKIVEYITNIDEAEINETISVPIEENVSEEINETESFNETVDVPIEEDLDEENISLVEENVTETILQTSVFDDLVLSDYEKKFLKDLFGSPVVMSNAVQYRDKVIVTFSLDAYSVSNSYEERLTDSEIMKVIERDRILWLRDIVREFDDSKEVYSDLNSLNEFYVI